MKKIINEPEKIVDEMCNGITLAHPDIAFDRKYHFLYKKKLSIDKVMLISGGGSGHEPAHGGFIGKGMLDAAVCGDVFASPTQIQIYQAIKRVAGEKGTLLIIKNYSGDVMNFLNAAYLAELDGLLVDYIKVADDIAVMDSLYTVGRRGVAGTVLVHKIAGAAAEQGESLSQVKNVAQKAADNVRSIGFSLTSCTVPAKGTPTFELANDEIEYGIGIHGEPGVRREKITTADELARRMVSALLEDLNAGEDDEVALLVNGFGGTPLMELYLLCDCAVAELSRRSVKTYRVFVGNYMTSLDMAGASISILKLDDEMKSLLDMPSVAPAFKVDGAAPMDQYVRYKEETDCVEAVSYTVESSVENVYIKDGQLTLNNLVFIVDQMSETIIENEVPFCELDSFAGDGDFGMSIAKGFRQIKKEWKNILHQAKDIESFLNACSEVILEHCGGASGPIWGFAFKMAAKNANTKTYLDVKGFAQLMQAAVKGVQLIGERSFGRGAVVGDKTLIDALYPCAEAWSKAAEDGASFKEGFIRSAEAAVDGAKNTEKMVARMGRAGTVGERSLGYPDAGAFALGVIFTKIADVMKEV